MSKWCVGHFDKHDINQGGWFRPAVLKQGGRTPATFPVSFTDLQF